MVGVWVFMGLSVSVCWKCLYKHWDGTALRESHPGWGQSPSAHLTVLTGGHHPRAAIEKVPMGTKSFSSFPPTRLLLLPRVLLGSGLTGGPSFEWGVPKAHLLAHCLEPKVSFPHRVPEQREDRHCFFLCGVWGSRWLPGQREGALQCWAHWLCGVSVEPDALHTDRQCHLRGSW